MSNLITKRKRFTIYPPLVSFINGSHGFESSKNTVTTKNSSVAGTNSNKDTLVSTTPLSSVSESVIFTKEEDTTAFEKGLILKKFFNYIERISHMDEVRRSQTNVMNIKQQLLAVTEEKRMILNQLEKVRVDLSHVYKDMKITSYQATDKYLLLVQEEIDFYSKERKLQEFYKSTDEKEQKLFNAFFVAINDSYDKEKVHSNFIKVFGLIGTIVCSFLTLLASVLTHTYNQNKFFALQQEFAKTSSDKRIDEMYDRLISLEKNNVDAPTESWSSYLKRNTRWIYGWAIPRNRR